MKKTILKGFHRPIQLIPACFKGFGCGLYFGGQRPAPKTMTVEMK